MPLASREAGVLPVAFHGRCGTCDDQVVSSPVTSTSDADTLFPRRRDRSLRDRCVPIGRVGLGSVARSGARTGGRSGQEEGTGVIVPIGSCTAPKLSLPQGPDAVIRCQDPSRRVQPEPGPNPLNLGHHRSRAGSSMTDNPRGRRRAACRSCQSASAADHALASLSGGATASDSPSRRSPDRSVPLGPFAVRGRGKRPWSVGPRLSVQHSQQRYQR